MSTESADNLLLLQQLEKLCQRANLDIERRNQEDINHGFCLKLNAGNDSINIDITHNEAKLIPKDDIFFETIKKISGMSEFHAYYSIEDRYIEAMINCEDRPQGHDSIYKNLIKPRINNEEENSRTVININNDNYSMIKLSIGLSTPTFSVLATLKDPISQPQIKEYSTIRIEQVAISSHEQALEILEKFATSLILELNYYTGVSIYLSDQGPYSKSLSDLKAESNRYLIKNRIHSKPTVDIKICAYEKSPLSLYIYSLSEEEMPVSQYLHYYQVIEFYLLKFADQEALRIMKETIKHSSFYQSEQILDSNINNLFKKIKDKIRGQTEEDLLKLTIKDCVNTEELKLFFQEKEDRQKFFKTYDKWKDITIRESPLSEGGDLINKTAIRIYDIRCQIVHTKNDPTDRRKFILPLSTQAQKLGYDIELVKFIARKVLEHFSKPFEL
ncbi:hypothetical protein [Trichormus variabilis]|uniref:Uncharacterized protein n=1 Tax=Trichormus variabilis SAG 1403-4b TaxID=447716 RepID=A0A3S1C658_ANAVA|nr:hypothetical protein [Trichormus variabilis]MBD2627906.1 hypothetical protein [Trichormus variabilis FACHB-164]RUS97286.1 hypothetical protein DSM107003_20270 [Trichormus variabilis SAG 1403-4b]